MNEDIDFSRFLTVGIVLLLMAFGGWGAFAYSIGAAQLRDRALQRELSLAATERQTLAGELDRLRVIADRDRRALESASRTLADVQQHAAALADQLRGREAPVPAGAAPGEQLRGREASMPAGGAALADQLRGREAPVPAGASRPGAALPPPTRQASGAAARQ